MGLTGLLITSFIVALSGAMAPGPLLTVTIAESVKRGLLAGLLLVVGHAVLEAALVVALALGLRPFISHHGVVTAISFAGGGFLLWMGGTIVRDAVKGKISLDPNVEATDGGNVSGSSSAGRLIGLGVVVSLSNPYWSLWWATFGLKYVVEALKWAWAGIAVFFIGHILADLIWYVAVSGVVTGGRRFLSPALYRGILTVAGLFLIGLGGYFIYGGFRFALMQ
ncbi:MAG: LysE family transporter [Bacillota bacterium]